MSRGKSIIFKRHKCMIRAFASLSLTDEKEAKYGSIDAFEAY